MNILLFDGPERNHLLPFTFVRPVAHLRIGIDQLIDKWEAFLKSSCTVFTQVYLSDKFPAAFEALNTFVNPSYIPTAPLATAILKLRENQALHFKGQLIACVSAEKQPPKDLADFDLIEWKDELLHLSSITDLYTLNDVVLQQDFQRITQGRTSAKIATTNQVISPENIFIEAGARVEYATLNAAHGPIYIGKDVEIMEGSMLRGSIALCRNTIVKMGAKIYGGTTIGPYSKVGGELNNVVIFGYSNKGHDGFLGNAVIGEWCNIGAATDASNLKNSYSKLRVWNYESENFAKIELQFCGLLMGDFSRCSIHSTFNSATVIGVCANLFGVGFPRTFIPSFSYGGAQGFKTNTFDKAMEANEAMMERKEIPLTAIDRTILAHVFELSSKWRKD